MKLLLDTHTFLWWLSGDKHLSARARTLIGNEKTTVFVSAASAWEICTKVRIGKLEGARAVAEDVVECVLSQAFTPLEITMDQAQRAGNLAGAHRDPFDRMLIAQAQALKLTLVSNEAIFDGFGVSRIW